MELGIYQQKIDNLELPNQDLPYEGYLKFYPKKSLQNNWQRLSFQETCGVYLFLSLIKPDRMNFISLENQKFRNIS